MMAGSVSELRLRVWPWLMPVALLATVALSCGASEAEPIVLDSPTPVASPTAEPATPTAEPATATPEPTPDPFASDRISCTEEVLTDPIRHNEILKEVLRRHQQALGAIPGVHGFGIGVVRKDGVDTGERGIKVGFDIELDAKDPEAKSLIPSSLEGCQVHLEVTNKGIEV